VGNITAYVDQFGYLVLFFALLLELLAFPLPGELLMTYSGFLVYQEKLNWALSILMAGVGTSIGMTLSYWIGYKLGAPFFEKYGHRFHMGPERIEKTSRWFNKHGNKVLIIAYFIPGVRHITGYFSGITRLPFRTYALFAYSGAFLWVAIFITLGKILGPQWEQFHTSVKKYLIIASIIAAVILVVLYVYKKYKGDLKDLAIKLLEVTLNILHSRKKVVLLLTATAVVTLGFIVLMIGIIQDFLGNEFQDFNEIAGLLIPLTFSENWTNTMLLFSFMGSRRVLITLLILTVIWIFWNGRDKVLELTLLVFVVCGGEIYEESLRKIFYKFSPIKQSLVDQLYSFPSEQSLMTFVIYGFIVFIFVRTIDKVSIRTFVPIVALILVVLIAISRLFLEIGLPSDVAAGYVFGGVWLGINVLLLEILRLLRNMDSHHGKVVKKQN
jgi:membrane protein DedA with SNARE-associated domain/membrane-associated phospholipid phosphatase